MGLIQLNLSKKALYLCTAFFLLNNNVLGLDFTLASNYEKVRTAILHNNAKKISRDKI